MVIAFSQEEYKYIWAHNEEKLQQYQKDLETQDPKEDGTFLRGAIQMCYQIKSKMIAEGYRW